MASLLRRALATLGIAWAVFTVAVPAHATDLLAPAVGAADSATAGSRVADPLTPSAALFANPAGLAAFDTVTFGGSLGLGFGRARLEASQPEGFEDTNDSWMLVPDGGLSVPYRRWRFAIGSYGATGSTFDYGPDPARGVPNFLSDTVMIAFPLGVAYRLGDRVSVGAEIQPMFGQLRTHFVQEGLAFRYKLNGPGIQGMLGASLRVTDTLDFGLGVRTPGKTWMGGSMALPGVGLQDVDVALKMPTQIFAGATWRALERVTVSAAVRFTDASTLGNSIIEYELTPQANIGFVPDAKDEWKVSAAIEYALREQWRLRLGASWASHIVGAKGVSPLLWDTDDIKISAGVAYVFDPWVLDVMIGYSLPGKRTIAGDEALVLPGRYSMEGGGILMVGLTHR